MGKSYQSNHWVLPLCQQFRKLRWEVKWKGLWRFGSVQALVSKSSIWAVALYMWSLQELYWSLTGRSSIMGSAHYLALVLLILMPRHLNLAKITVIIGHKLGIVHGSVKSTIFQEDFTLTILGTWPKAVRNVQMVLMFHLIEHQENQCWIVRLVHKVNCLRRCPMAKSGLQGIMVVVFIKINVQSKMMNTTTMIPARARV